MSLKTTISMINNVSPVLTNVIESMNMVISCAYKLNDSTDNMIDVSSLDASLASLRNAQSELANMENFTANLENEHRNYNDTVSKSEGLLSGIKGKVIGIVGAYAGLQSIKAFTNLGDELTSINSRLSFMLGKEEKLFDVQSRIAQAAKSSRTNYKNMADSVAKLTMLAGDAFSGLEEATRFSEILNKNFKVGGASAEEQAAAMYQLTQAMASGRLQGDEFVSIRENAPLLAQAIAKTMNVSMGELKELSSEGAITADVIKRAMFESADEIETRFKKIPKTFSDLKTELVNTFILGLQKPLSNLTNFIDTESFQNLFNGLINGVMIFSHFVGIGVDLFIKGFELMGNAITYVGPPLLSLISMFLFYKGIVLAHNAIASASAAIHFIMARAMSLYAMATGKATAIQGGFNAALLASPLFWIPTIIIGVIALIYGIVAAINKVTGSTYSATGLIVGIVQWTGATILNIAIGLINGLIQLMYAGFASPFISIIEWVLNVAKGGFDSFGDAVKNLIGNIISWFLDLGRVVTKIIDAIFGTDWTGGLEELQNKVLGWGKNENAITLDREVSGIERIEAKKWFNKGYAWGEDKAKSIKSLIGQKKFENSLNSTDFLNMDDLSNPLDEIAENTKSMNEKMKDNDWENNNLSALKGLMETRAISDLSKGIKLEVYNQFTGDIKSDVDAEKIIDEANKKLLKDLILSINGG
ncbi:tape measure protein [Peptoniphilus sp.]|uniref:tape measure protein n=1 Tax=Peptoniphilus sp. TaxID=1971214 RepID=UPI002A831089|nr:tape measure protein [Peptoniphilus sp.]MDY3902454.1 tape measure protein [Peptoniphilus sp.]